MEKFICLNCGKEFEASKYYARYCSDRCRQKSYNERLREQKNSQPKKPTAKPESK